MGKSTGDSKKLLEYVDGRENIATIPHCVTRMRFVPDDPSKAGIKTIESLSSVKDTFTQAGQLQAMIGNEVSTFYGDLAEAAGIGGISKEAVKKAAIQSQTLIQRITSSPVEIPAPLIPTIIVGGLALGFCNIIGEIALFDGGTKTLTRISVFRADINSFLRLIGEATFYFLPTCIVWPITKKMGTTQALGIALGITPVSPWLLNAYSVVATATAEIPKWNFELFQVGMIGYRVQVFPVVPASSILVCLERFFRRICPTMISMIAVLFCSLLVSVTVARSILGSIGWKIGAVISDCMNTGLVPSFRDVLAGIFSFFYASFVITGPYHMSSATDPQLVTDFGDTTLWPMTALSNIAQGSAVLVMILLQKNDARAKEVSVSACISCYLDVTEPAMFGMNLKYGFPFICGMTGSAVGAMLFVVNEIKADVTGMGGISDIPSIQPQYMGFFVAAMGLVILTSFCLTYTMGRKKGIGGGQENQNESGHEASQGERKDSASQPIKGLKAHVPGEVTSVEDVPGQVFVSRALGDRVAIELENSILRTPADAMVAVVMEESLHICGSILDNGMELPLYIGPDTADMKGDGSRASARPGNRVRIGEELIIFDHGKIAGAGHSDMVIMVLTGPGDSGVIGWQTGRGVRASVDVVVRID